jgi:hypothetical protein
MRFTSISGKGPFFLPSSLQEKTQPLLEPEAEFLSELDRRKAIFYCITTIFEANGSASSPPPHQKEAGSPTLARFKKSARPCEADNQKFFGKGWQGFTTRV